MTDPQLYKAWLDGRSPLEFVDESQSETTGNDSYQGNLA